MKDGRVWNEASLFNVSKELDSIPCGIPYRCLVPKAAECTKLLSPTCPSSSYVAYGAYLIEFTFMVAAPSTAAVMSMEVDTPVQSVSCNKLRERLLEDKQVLAVPVAP